MFVYILFFFIIIFFKAITQRCLYEDSNIPLIFLYLDHFQQSQRALLYTSICFFFVLFFVCFYVGLVIDYLIEIFFFLFHSQRYNSMYKLEDIFGVKVEAFYTRLKF